MLATLCKTFVEFIYIQPQARTLSQADGFPLDIQPISRERFVERRKRPAQGGTSIGLVIFRPEQGCQRVARVSLPGNSEIGNECHCFARIHVDDYTIAFYTWWAKQK